jgi:hypothetical protein
MCSLCVSLQGDSRIRVYRQGEFMRLTEAQQSYFNCPYQMACGPGHSQELSQAEISWAWPQPGDVVLAGEAGGALHGARRVRQGVGEQVGTRKGNARGQPSTFRELHVIHGLAGHLAVLHAAHSVLEPAHVCVNLCGACFMWRHGSTPSLLLAADN